MKDDITSQVLTKAFNDVMKVFFGGEPTKGDKRCIKRYVLQEMRPKVEELLKYNQRLEVAVLNEMFIYYLAHFLDTAGCLGEKNK